ncbi:hypothetical protein CRN84_25560 [Budvicia aquatica]|uniref:Uncharacterized protein n=1 Tax=Budvicia aquatica TaxID=82979 RepID=A0A2C6D0I2_9GAMM|nr:hypothetical protein CRN84_25560 [Budvicia aquatica]
MFITHPKLLIRLYRSYFKWHLCWPRSLTRITDLSKRIGTRSLAAAMPLKLFWYIKWLCLK